MSEQFTSTESEIYDDVYDADTVIEDNLSVSSLSDVEDDVEEFDCNENTILVKPDLLGVKRSKIINKAINDYVVEFLSTFTINSSTDNNSIIAEWNSKDNQYQLNGYIHQNKIKMKKKVDLNEPKKWDNEFTYFSREMRQKIKTENPDADDRTRFSFGSIHKNSIGVGKNTTNMYATPLRKLEYYQPNDVDTRKIEQLRKEMRQLGEQAASALSGPLSTI